MAYVEYVVEGMRKEAKLDQAETTFGRASDCSVHLVHDVELSRKHCVIRRAPDGKYALADLDSSNGTFLNDTKLEEEQPLSDGDRFRIGRTVITFRDQEVGFQTQIFGEMEAKMNKGAGFHTLMQEIIGKRKR